MSRHSYETERQPILSSMQGVCYYSLPYSSYITWSIAWGTADVFSTELQRFYLNHQMMFLNGLIRKERARDNTNTYTSYPKPTLTEIKRPPSRIIIFPSGVPVRAAFEQRYGTTAKTSGGGLFYLFQSNNLDVLRQLRSRFTEASIISSNLFIEKADPEFDKNSERSKRGASSSDSPTAFLQFMSARTPQPPDVSKRQNNNLLELVGNPVIVDASCRLLTRPVTLPTCPKFMPESFATSSPSISAHAALHRCVVSSSRWGRVIPEVIPIAQLRLNNTANARIPLTTRGEKAIWRTYVWSPCFRQDGAKLYLTQFRWILKWTVYILQSKFSKFLVPPEERFRPHRAEDRKTLRQTMSINYTVEACILVWKVLFTGLLRWPCLAKGRSFFPWGGWGRGRTTVFWSLLTGQLSELSWHAMFRKCVDLEIPLLLMDV